MKTSTQTRSPAFTKLMIAAALFGSVACSEEPNTTPDNTDPGSRPDQGMNAKPDQDILTPDMDMGQVTDDGMTCQPKTQCPADTCGSVSDGCGGELDCGAPKTCETMPDACGVVSDGCGGELDCGVCLCQGGQPLKPTCGTCALGQVDCSTPRGACQMPQDIECKQAFYVKLSTSGEGDGSLAKPFGRLVDAIAKAKSLGPDHVVVILGSDVYQESETIDLIEGIHILGGYDEAGVPDSSQVPTLTHFANTDGAQVAIRAENLERKTILSGLVVQSHYAAGVGQDSIGLLVNNAPGLVLRDVVIVSGQGGDGMDGDKGQDGASGQAGAVLPGLEGEQWGSQNPSNPRSPLIVGTRSPQVSNGVNNLDCPLASGYIGGEGAYVTLSSGQLVTMPAQSGGGMGAAANAGSASQLFGGPGQAGADGITPSSQPAPDPLGLGIRLLDTDIITVQGDGAQGQSGSYGHGGQGGGGAYVWGQFSNGREYRIEGPQGGGGGAGGCGGRGGQGGTQGGHAIAILSASEVDFTLERVTLRPGHGGRGGKGGVGGKGGQGGPGRLGGTKVINILSDTRDLFAPGGTYKGGTGGTGGKGGDGAQGQDGAPGVSVGIACLERRGLPQDLDVTFIPLSDAFKPSLTWGCE